MRLIDVEEYYASKNISEKSKRFFLNKREMYEEMKTARK